MIKARYVPNTLLRIIFAEKGLGTMRITTRESLPLLDRVQFHH
jgi:hypothetical protein